MKTISITKARSSFYKLIDETAESHTPVKISGKLHNAILIGEEDWSAIEETLFLLSIPGMRESIIKGMQTPIEKCADKLKW
ncbi:MAG: type II toxin-antitoxin system Phd/YefM family antitoxin [Nitrospirae bacterium]|nr:type II toxin-antitoxin system Phd/YefM family antitoxin [Nitrospirota bacterium]MBI3352377.1 type II toxin-antitoxin system Phd/YefM family antitoxin [Nitrospirota bacterium]